jgi:ribulose-phosphate 3-epimerase
MIQESVRYLELIARHGADIIYIHPDSCTHPAFALDKIKGLGASPGIAVNPDISYESVKELLPLVEYLLVMTVNPGTAGQPYLDYVEPKVWKFAEIKDKFRYKLIIDGGVDWVILKRLKEIAVDGFVLGKQVLFGKEEAYKTIVEKIREL